MTNAPVSADGGCGYRARPARVERPRDVGQLRRILAEAGREGRQVCVRGAGRSQGGLVSADDAVVVDISRLNRILEIDVAAGTARAQAGVTWDQLRTALDPYGLSTLSNQSYGVFTVGGSVSVNAHGRNVDTGVLAATVLSMRVMLADGSLVEASRTQNAELFGLVLGGLGLFGVVVDVTLRLVPNHAYIKSRVSVMPTAAYPAYVASHVRADPNVHFHYARFTVLESELWERLFCIDYHRLDGEDGAGLHDPVRPDLLGSLDLAKHRLLLWASRDNGWVRRHRFGWELQHRARPERSRRNNVAKEPWRALSSGASRRVDRLQEFFVPVEEFLPFITRAAQILRAENFRILNTTVRFVPRNEDAFLSYARRDCFAVVIFYEQNLEATAVARAEAVFRQLLDCALECGGTYYLCYHRFASCEQLVRAYPRIGEFFKFKLEYDPAERFTHQFHAQYSR